MTDQTIEWLRGLAAQGGKGVVNNIDARCLGRIADDLVRLEEARRIYMERADKHAIDANGLRARLEKAKLALENIAAWRKVNMVGEFERRRDIIWSMTDCAANALDSLTDENSKSGAPT